MGKTGLNRILVEAHDADIIALEAFEAGDSACKRRCAERALEANALCVQAYCILGSLEEPGSDSQVDLYQRAVYAGMTLLGAKARKATVGAYPEARSLARALFGLGQAFIAADMMHEAIETFDSAIHIDKDDGFHARYQLARCLLQTGQTAHLTRLLKAYGDDKSSVWLWTLALTSFKLDADVALRDGALEDALDANPYLAGYLIGKRRWDGATPLTYRPGDEAEAAWYAAQFQRFWTARPAALQWLAARSGIH